MNKYKPYLSLSLLAILFSIISFSQNKYKLAPDAAGKWDYSYINEAKSSYRSDANYMLSASELATFKKKINSVVETLHQNPVTSNPVGYEATVTACIYANMYRYKYNVANLAGMIPHSEIVVRFCPLYVEVATGKYRKNCLEVFHCNVWLNDIEQTVSGAQIFEPIDKSNPHDDAAAKRNEVFQAPEVYKQLSEGVTLYTNSVMIFAKPGKPYWLPVTAGEYFDRLIKYWTLESEKEGNHLFLDMLLKEKEKFSEEDLRKPAYNGENPVSQITVKPNERPYMRKNPDYFDKTLPRTAVQLITINVNSDLLDKNFDPKHYLKAETYMDILRYYEYCKAIDVEKIKSLLD